MTERGDLLQLHCWNNAQTAGSRVGWQRSRNGQWQCLSGTSSSYKPERCAFSGKNASYHVILATSRPKKMHSFTSGFSFQGLLMKLLLEALFLVSALRGIALCEAVFSFLCVSGFYSLLGWGQCCTWDKTKKRSLADARCCWSGASDWSFFCTPDFRN